MIYLFLIPNFKDVTKRLIFGLFKMLTEDFQSFPEGPPGLVVFTNW